MPSKDRAEAIDRTVEPFERLRHAAVVVDRSGRIASVNGRAEQLLGRARGDVIGSLLRGRATPAAAPDIVRPRRLRPAGARTMWIEAAGDELMLVRVDLRRESRDRWLVLLEEATSLARAESAIAFERSTLALITSGVHMSDVAAHMARALGPLLEAHVVVFVADRDATRLVPVRTPSLPAGIAAALPQEVPISPDGPPCGSAAARKRPVVIRDITTGVDLDDVMRRVLSDHGVSACWSVPALRAGTTDVIGVVTAFAMSGEDPSDDDMDLLARAAELAALILERDRAEADRHALEHRYRTLATMSSDFAYCFEMDPGGAPRLAWVTDAFRHITGYEPDEWMRMGAWRGIIHPDDLLAFEQRLPRLMRGEEVSGEFRILTKSGEVRWLSVLTRPITDAQGHVTTLLGAAHDFTARKEAEDAKTMFLATASHELKTPLTVIQGFAQLLGTDRADEDVSTEAVSAIRRRAVQLTKIIDRILLSSRIETGRAAVHVTAVDAGPILVELTDALAGATGRDVTLDIDALPFVEADPDALATVVDHLLDNAVKYSPDGGPIRVRARADADQIRIEVIDEGIGMTDEQVARCFEKFWQAESTDVRRFGGTGIGLFIVRSLVEGMGGTVDVASTPGRGSTFTVTLRPATDATPPVGEPSVIKEFMRQLGIPERSER